MNKTNIADYFKERFPLVNMLLFAILFMTVHSVAGYFSVSNSNDVFKITIGIIATISFFFRLRVFDEIKDFKIDAINHPGRVLQSGRVSIRQLITISVVLSIFEISWSILCGFPTLLCWLIALAYSLLMRYEFFIGDFLKKRLIIYACTHMLVMPLIILWIWSGFYEEGLQHSALYILAALSLTGGFSFEIARKIHVANAESPTVDSYSKSMGFWPAIICVLTLLFVGILIQSYLLYLIKSRIWAYLIIIALYTATCIVYASLKKQALEKKLRLAEILVSLFMLLSYLSIIFEIQF